MPDTKTLVIVAAGTLAALGFLRWKNGRLFGG